MKFKSLSCQVRNNMETSFTSMTMRSFINLESEGITKTDWKIDSFEI